MEHITFVGLDVHKRKTSVAIAEPGRGGEVRFLGEIPSTPEALYRLVERLRGRHRHVFQLAEVAVPRALFAEILRWIDDLRLRPPRSRHEDRERMNDDNPSRRGAAMIDKELPKRAQEAKRRPQTTALGSPTDPPRTSVTCLTRRTDAWSPFRSRQLGNPGSRLSRMCPLDPGAKTQRGLRPAPAKRTEEA